MEVKQIFHYRNFNTGKDKKIHSFSCPPLVVRKNISIIMKIAFLPSATLDYNFSDICYRLYSISKQMSYNYLEPTQTSQIRKVT